MEECDKNVAPTKEQKQETGMVGATFLSHIFQRNMIIPYDNDFPQISPNVFIAPDAWVIGDVLLGEHVSVFFGSILRGDILKIRVGKETNIQELSVVHTSVGRWETAIGEQVTVGHRALLHGCRVGNRVLVGMGAIILDETEIGDECIIGAGTVVTEGKKIPPRSMVMGVPGRVVRELTEDELKFLPISAARYVKVGQKYLQSFASRASSSSLV